MDGRRARTGRLDQAARGNRVPGLDPGPAGDTAVAVADLRRLPEGLEGGVGLSSRSATPAGRARTRARSHCRTVLARPGMPAPLAPSRRPGAAGRPGRHGTGNNPRAAAPPARRAPL